MKVNWDSKDSVVLLNPRLPSHERDLWLQCLDPVRDMQGHVWLTTSGTSGHLKWVGLSKAAVLASAGAVNRHLGSDASDTWLYALPTFHVGGLGILARSYLSGAKVVTLDTKWDPVHFHQKLGETEATLSALVPAQVYDLVCKNLPAPPSVRGIIVGGGALHEGLYKEARDRGWPLLPSYGMTECSSQIATAKMSGDCSLAPSLHLLDHIEAKVDDQQRLWIKSPALLSCYVYRKEPVSPPVDPKKEGWFQTEDLGELHSAILTLFGRSENFLKIGGESVDFLRLEKILEEVRMQLHVERDMALLPMADDRLGHVIHLAVEETEMPHEHLEKIIAGFNQRAFPFEKIRRVHVVSAIPRTALGKILRKELLESLTHLSQGI